MEPDLIAGRYRLGEPLGSGAMASVREAEDLELGRRVAVKLLAPDADRRRFEREARAVASLGHPGIVRVFDFGESPAGPYIVLELMPGGTLEERLPPGEPLANEETTRVAVAVAEALAHAHARGVVHRDLKPANVLFDDEGRPKLTDFGIARVAGQGTTLTEAGTMLGTADYMAPEAARGEAVGPAGDVYAFGVLLYRMLTGRLPFEGENALAVASMHAAEEPAPIASLRPDAPARLESVASASLAKDPRDRPADGAELLAELRTAAPAAPLRPRAEQPVPRRRPAVALSVAGAAVLAAAGLALALLAGRGGDEAPARLTGTSGSTGPGATGAASTPTDRGRETDPAPTGPTGEETTTAETATTGTTAPTETVPTEPTSPTTPTQPLPTGTDVLP